MSSPIRTLVLRAATALSIFALVVAACAGAPPARPAAPGSAAGVDASTTSPESTSPVASSTEPAQSATASPGSVLSPVTTKPSAPAAATSTRFPGGLLIADEGNGRLLVIDVSGKILWHFPTTGSLPPGQRFTADDAFLSPDGKTIVANDETHQVVDRIDIATKKVVWQYGHYGRAGSGIGFLHNPDDAYPLANGNLVVADIVNCRILEIAPSKAIVRMWGRTGVCVDRAGSTYGDPNGDTPLPDGGLLITEIRGSRVVRLSATGTVIFDIHVPTIYPSDAQLDANGNIIVADYSNPGAVVAVSPAGKLLWRYAPTSGPGRLDHPSLATPLADGTVSVNDDFRHRMVVIDPKTMRIVWQYGKTDVPGRAPGYLSQPDGHQPVPAWVVF